MTAVLVSVYYEDGRGLLRCRLCELPAPDGHLLWCSPGYRSRWLMVAEQKAKGQP